MAFEIIIILSLIQGITEFLPISSSAHLIIIPEFFLNIDSSKGFDVSLHFGSLFAVIYYLKKDLMKIISDTIYFKKDNEGFILLKNLSNLINPPHLQNSKILPFLLSEEKKINCALPTRLSLWT